MTILPKGMYRFNVIPIKSLFSFFTDKEKKHPKVHMKPPKTLDNQSNSEQKEQSWGTTVPDLKIYDRTIVKKNNVVLTQNLHAPQLSKTEDPNIGKENFSHLIFDSDTPNISW